MSIDKFRGDYFFLSNMYPLAAAIATNQNILVPSSEHVYMSDRFESPETQVMVASARGLPEDDRIYKDGLAAKELAHELIESGEPQVADFEVVRVGLMLAAVRKKFEANSDIREANRYGLSSFN